MQARIGAALAALVLAGCSLIPGAATPPSAGLWEFTYELGASDASAVGSKLTRRIRINGGTVLGEDGRILGLVRPGVGGATEISVDDILAGVCSKTGPCNGSAMLSMKASGPSALEGILVYQDADRSLKVGPVRATASLVDTSTPPPEPSQDSKR